jgi:hypothetical protein
MCINSIPKYIKVTKGGKARKEWSQEGNAHFNTVFAQLKELRSFPVGSSNEAELFKLCNDMRCVSRNNSRVEESVGDESSISDNEVIVVVYEA